ncbi:hypothetical protein ACRB90_004616 [Escherichia coli]
MKIENAQGSGITTEGNIKVDGAGSVGLDIAGNGNTINQNGSNLITNNATGNNVTGDKNTVNINNRTEVHGVGSTGNHVTGSDNTVNQNGEQVVTSGGTGSLLDGQNNTVNIKGNTNVKGSGSVGSSIEGDKGTVTVEGDLNVSDGATGAHIKGENGAVTVTGKVHVTDKDSVGINVTGNNASVITNGGITVKEEGTGIHIIGNNTQASGIGNITVNGKGTTGIIIDGNKSKITHNGTLTVANGGMGVNVNGDLANISTNVLVNVSDHDSVGINITGSESQLINTGDIFVTNAGTGAIIHGVNNTVTLGGNITVDARPDKNDNSILDLSTGVSIKGNKNKVNILGNVALQHSELTQSIDGYHGVTGGVIVSGNENNVVVDGSLSARYSSEYLNVSGGSPVLLDVSGSKNITEILGGIQINNNTPGTKSLVAIKSSGDNTIILNGHSIAKNESPDNGGGIFAHITDGAKIHLSSNSVVEIINIGEDLSTAYSGVASFYLQGEETQFINDGVIDASKTVSAPNLVLVRTGTTGINNGSIIASQHTIGKSSALISASGVNASFINEIDGSIHVSSSVVPYSVLGGTISPNKLSGVTGMSANNGSYIHNKGSIIVDGPAFAFATNAEGSGKNEGSITLNGYINGKNIKDLPNYDSSDIFAYGAAMVVRGGYNPTSVVNTGKVEILNSGTGLIADGSKVAAINQGTVKLDISDGVTDSKDQLYGMAAINGGTAINAENGKIIITGAAKDVAKPFYRDDNVNSLIINMGQICIGDDCENSENFNKKPENTDIVTSSFLGGVLTEKNKELTINNTGLLILPSESTSSNKGTVKGGDIILGLDSIQSTEEGKTLHLDNQQTGNIVSNIQAVYGSFISNAGNISGNITLKGGVLSNLSTGDVSGKIDVSEAGVVHNSSSLTASDIKISKGNLFNSGNLKSSISNNTGLFVNAGTFTNSHTTGNVANGNSTFVNETDAIVSSNNGYNTVYASGSNNIVINKGTIKEGYSNSKKTTRSVFIDGQSLFVNKGVVNAKVTNSGVTVKNGAEFVNDTDGIINLSGESSNNTIAVQVESGNTKAINNGIINLGSQTGKNTATGLVGMQLDRGVSTDAVIENNGTINIYTNKSYAFSKEGSNGRVINNGYVVFGENVTDSSLFKQPDLADTIEGSAGKNNTPQVGIDEVHVGYINPDDIFIAPVLKLTANGKDKVITNKEKINAIDSQVINGATYINDKNADIRIIGNISVKDGSTFYNKGFVGKAMGQTGSVFRMNSDGATVINAGTMANTGNSTAIAEVHSARSVFWNTEDGLIDYSAKEDTGGKTTAISLNGNDKTLAINDGTIQLSGNNAIGMNIISGNGKAINNGTINLGVKNTGDSGMVAMQLSSDAGANAVLENNGFININANNSFAFSKYGDNGRIINNGAVNIAAGVTGSGIIKQPELAGSIESGVNVDYIRPDVPTGKPGVNIIEGYTIGTTASGHAGKLTANNAVLKDVTVNTGFAAGTAERSITFGDVVTGKNIQGAENIRSESVVWNAQGRLNEKGNVDVTMTKNNYADVADDASVVSVANALDKAYTNNALFSSLNVKTSQELSNALRQISGSQATTAFNDARILSSRFDRLAAEAPEISNGLAFNAISRNDQRAELGNKVRYDMFALKQAFTLDESQTVELGYGIARLNGSGSSQAGDNGLTGGWSQFLSLKHRLSFGEDYSWSNSLRYDRHVLESNRLIRYGDVNKVASAQNRQQYMEYRTEGNKHIQLADGLNLTPSLGLKLRHTVNGNLNERGAGDFNLGLNSSMETAVDSVVGLKLDYTGKDGWSASAKLEGGPNLSYVKSQRTGVLQGAKGVRFNLDDGQKGGGLNGLAEVGMSYSKDNKSLSASAFQWKEDGIQDKGFMLNYNVRF